MNTLVGAAEPPEQQPAWSISYLQAKCPHTGVSVWMGCRGPCCRPDLHVLSAQPQVVTYAGFVPAMTAYAAPAPPIYALPNTTGGASPGYSRIQP
jgi:hypothetical protein